jgi:transmembrane sensor
VGKDDTDKHDETTMRKTTTPPDSGKNDRHAAAVAWHVRLYAGDAGEEDWVAFAAWLQADDENRQAFDRVDILMADLEAAGEDLRAHFTAPAGLPGESGRHMRARWRAWGPALALIAATLVVFVGIGQGWFGGIGGTGTPGRHDYATRIGETRAITLADGSVIHLNTDSKITVALGARTRDVTLDHGEVLFQVTRDPARPFIVTVGEQNVRVVGTVFNILRYGGKVTVTVARGVVEVHPARTGSAHEAGLSATLVAGHQLVHEDGAPTVQVRKVDPRAALSWREGHRTYDNASLRDIAGDLNRYFPVSVSVQNEAVAALRFSGVLKFDNEQAVLRRLEEFLPVTAEKTKGGIVLRLRKEHH